MKPHEQRVVDELNELLTKYNKLKDFSAKSPIFDELSDEERRRLFRQQTYMRLYIDVLEERIAAFPSIK